MRNPEFAADRWRAAVRMCSFVVVPAALAGLTGCTPSPGANTATATAPSQTPQIASNTPAAAPSAPPPAPSPSPSPTPTPKKIDGPIRGIYITGWTAGGKTRWNQLIGMVDKTPLNAVVIDVKEDGMLSYAIDDIPLAKESGANQKMIPDIDAKLADLKKHNIYAIARITVFRDRIIPKKHPELSVQRPDGSVWRDRSGHYWMDPYNQKNWDYSIDVAADALRRGFDEIQWDYVRFPSEGALSSQRYPAKAKDDQRSRARVISDFMRYSREKLKPMGAVVSADIFGLTVSAKPDDDMGIGQKIDLMTPQLDLICPMVYPSHYARGEYGIPHPNASPYRTVFRAMQDTQARVKGTQCKIRPWLQDFSLGVHYGEKQVRDQIRAAEENGIQEYLLWNAGNRYTFSATIPPRSKAKKNKKATAPVTATASPSPAASPSAAPSASPTAATDKSAE